MIKWTHKMILFLLMGIMERDRLFQDNLLDADQLELCKELYGTPSPEEYQAGLARQYKKCETKTHQKGFAFWNEYKKSKGKI